MLPPRGILDEVVGVLEERVANDRRDVLLPVVDRAPEECLVVAHVIEVGEVVVVVAREQLVRGRPADRDAVPVLVDRLHQEPVHEVGDRVERGVVVAHKLAQLGEEVALVGGNRGVAHAEHLLGVLDHVVLLVALVLVDDREAVHVVVENVLGDRDERHRVDPAAHAERERNVGTEAQLDRPDQALPRARDRLLVRHAVGVRPGALPVAATALLAGGPALEPAAGRQLLEALEERLAGLVERLVAVDEIAAQVGVVHPQRLAEQRCDELDLGAEVEVVTVAVDVQRLLAEAVAAQPQRLRPLVVAGEAPHAFAPVERVPAAAVERRGQHLGVGLGAELGACVAEVVADLEVVVELAVEGEPRRARAERLVGARIEVDDAQPREQQVDAVARVGRERAVGAGVRPAVVHEAQRPLDALARDGRRPGVAGYSAHQAHRQSGMRKSSIIQMPSRRVQTSGLLNVSAISKKRSSVMPAHRQKASMSSRGSRPCARAALRSRRRVSACRCGSRAPGCPMCA